jgi:two-component system response regulator MtrA
MDEHVLLVEDDASIREVTTLALEQSGLRVTAVGDGREGLDRFRRGGVDLVVLDVMLPSLDGFEVLREIRHDSQAPIVMLTARSELHDVVVGLELGADDYVTKPFELPELVARVKAVLRRASPASRSTRTGSRRGSAARSSS